MMLKDLGAEDGPAKQIARDNSLLTSEMVLMNRDHQYCQLLEIFSLLEILGQHMFFELQYLL